MAKPRNSLPPYQENVPSYEERKSPTFFHLLTVAEADVLAVPGKSRAGRGGGCHRAVTGGDGLAEWHRRWRRGGGGGYVLRPAWSAQRALSRGARGADVQGQEGRRRHAAGRSGEAEKTKVCGRRPSAGT